MADTQPLIGARGMTVEDLLDFHRAHFGDARMDASGPSLTHSQAVNRLREITTELERLGELDTLSREDEAYFEELTRSFTEVDEHRKRLERSAELERVRAAASGLDANVRRVPGSGGPSSREDYDRDAILEPDSVEDARFRNPWDLTEVRTFGRTSEEVGVEMRARALSAVEKMQGANDKVRAAATHILESFDDKDARLARMALITSSPEYLRAWSKMARGNQHLLKPEEAQALERAMSLTDASGGYLVPFQLDPTVIITANGSRNDIRNAARQVVATGDRWNGVSSGSVQWRWAAEESEATDGATTFVQPFVDLHKADGFVPISIEALMDEANVTSEVAKLLAFGKDELEAVAFITGTGTGQPKGIVTALTGTSAEIAPTTVETFAVADVYKVQGALPARFRDQASWLANNLTYNTIRQFDSAGGSALWARLGEGRPDGLLGRTVLEAEAMAASTGINPAVTAQNRILVHGDFEHYVIADRIGMTVEFIPHLVGANRRPTGQRGWYAFYRVGADTTNAGAFKMLNVATTL